jgi:hypothetical protein
VPGSELVRRGAEELRLVTRERGEVDVGEAIAQHAQRREDGGDAEDTRHVAGVGRRTGDRLPQFRSRFFTPRP